MVLSESRCRCGVRVYISMAQSEEGGGGTTRVTAECPACHQPVGFEVKDADADGAPSLVGFETPSSLR